MGAASTEPTPSEELRALLTLWGPITLSHLLGVATDLIETAIVGHASSTDLGGVAIGGSIVMTVSLIPYGLTVGLGPLAAQAVGAGEMDRAWAALVTTLKAVVVLCPLLMIAVLLLSYMIEPLGINHAITAQVRDYALGVTPGLCLGLLYNTGNTFLVAHGRTRPGLVAGVVGVAVVAILCNLLVRGDETLFAVGLQGIGLPRLGAFGAGVSASIGSAIGVAIVARATWGLRPVVRTVRVPLGVCFRLGVPIGLQYFASGGALYILAVLIGRFGAAALAAHQIALGLARFTAMGAAGVAEATSVRVGYAIGQARPVRRAGITGITLAAALMSVGAMTFAGLPGPLVRLFTNDVDTVKVAASLLSIAAVFQLIDGVQAAAAGALRGAGEVRFPFLATAGSSWIVGFPVACVLGFTFGFGVQGVWWGLTAGLLCEATLLMVRFARVAGGKIARL
jgi:multidrug resistance protein, MATE family